MFTVKPDALRAPDVTSAFNFWSEVRNTVAVVVGFSSGAVCFVVDVDVPNSPGSVGSPAPDAAFFAASPDALIKLSKDKESFIFRFRYSLPLWIKLRICCRLFIPEFNSDTGLFKGFVEKTSPKDYSFYNDVLLFIPGKTW